MRVSETVERTDYGESVSEASGRPYIISLQNHWNRERSSLNQSVVNYRYGWQWEEYLFRTDYKHFHSVYTPISRWNVGRPWNRRKDWQPWSGIRFKWLTPCCLCRSMKHSLKQFREKRVIMWDGIMWLWIATKADSSKQITDISDSMKGWRLWLGECQLLQVKNFMEFTGFICFG